MLGTNLDVCLLTVCLHIHLAAGIPKQVKRVVRIQKRFALSPRLFAKAIEVISGVSKSIFSIFPITNVEIISLYL